MVPHNISSPIGTMASAHLCAAMPNFLVLEHHGIEVPELRRQRMNPMGPEKPTKVRWIVFVLMFGTGYAVGKALQWILRTTLTQAARRTENTLDDQLIDYLTAPVVQTTVILALVAAEKSFDFGPAVDWFLIRALFTLLLVLWGRAWFKATHLAIVSMSRQVDRFELFQPRTRPLFEMGVKLFLFTIFVWLFMKLWSIDGTAWLASAGVIGIAVGFAARDTLANLISGVSIIADAPYKIGDYVVLDNNLRGEVLEIGMRSTRLLTRDNVEVTVPNAVITAKQYGQVCRNRM